MNSKKEQYFWNFISSIFFIFLVSLVSLYVYKNQISLNVPVFTFIILSLAVFRLTWLFVYDLVMDFVRDYFNKSERGIRKTISDLLGCPWCTGVWMSLIVVFLYIIHPITWIFIFIMAIAGLGTLVNVLIRSVWKRIP